MQGAVKEAHPGEVVGGRFRIEAELGEGGMAQVFRVTDVATGRPYALKLIKQEVAADAQAVARLRREGEVLTNLDNPAVVAIETFGKLDDGRLFIAMELLEGETLGDKMRRMKRLPLDELIPIVTGAAAGLTAAHQAGVIHRDLKPDNIFLQRLAGDRVQVKLLDFGISKVYGVEERLTRTGQILGTPRYMAPEQLAADHDLDGRVDTYALGVILYEALAGSPPFIATSPSDLIVAILHGKATPLSTLRADLSEDLVAVVMRAMARAREARYGTPRDLAEAFLEAAGGTRRESSPGPRGVGTAVLGGGGTAPLQSPPREEGLRVGTFSALQPLAPPSASASASRPSDTATVAGKKAAMAAIEPTSPPAMSPADPSGLADARESFPGSMGAMGGASDSHPLGLESGTFDASPALPTHSRRWIWIVAALVAGGLSASVAIYLLESSDESSTESSETEDAAQTPPQTALQPPTSERAETASDHPVENATDMHELPSGAIVPSEIPASDDDEDGSSDEREGRRRNSMSAMSESMSDTGSSSDISDTNDMVPEPFVAETTEDPYARAQTALARGDAETCLTILRDARLLGPRALRLEADCFLRAGRRDDAVKAYEEFCRRYPDNASTAAIRGLVESLGGTCP